MVLYVNKISPFFILYGSGRPAKDYTDEKKKANIFCSVCNDVTRHGVWMFVCLVDCYPISIFMSDPTSLTISWFVWTLQVNKFKMCSHMMAFVTPKIFCLTWANKVLGFWHNIYIYIRTHIHRRSGYIWCTDHTGTYTGVFCLVECFDCATLAGYED